MAKNIPKPKPVDDGQNTPEGQQAARDAQNAYERSIGNIESIPESERTRNDWSAYLLQLRKRIEQFAPFDASSCIARGDVAFNAYIAEYNRVSTMLGDATKYSEADFNHAPFCVPLKLGTGGRQQ